MTGLIVNPDLIFRDAAILMLSIFPEECLTQLGISASVRMEIAKIQNNEDDYLGTALALFLFNVSINPNKTASDRTVMANISSAFFVSSVGDGPCDKSALDMADILKDESWTKKLLTTLPDAVKFTSAKKYTKLNGKAEEMLRIADYVSNYDSDSELAQDILPDLGEAGDDERTVNKGVIANLAKQVTDQAKDIFNVE